MSESDGLGAPDTADEDRGTVVTPGDRLDGGLVWTVGAEADGRTSDNRRRISEIAGRSILELGVSARRTPVEGGEVIGRGPDRTLGRDGELAPGDGEVRPKGEPCDGRWTDGVEGERLGLGDELGQRVDGERGEGRLSPGVGEGRLSPGVDGRVKLGEEDGRRTLGDAAARLIPGVGEGRLILGAADGRVKLGEEDGRRTLGDAAARLIPGVGEGRLILGAADGRVKLGEEDGRRTLGDTAGRLTLGPLDRLLPRPRDIDGDDLDGRGAEPRFVMLPRTEGRRDFSSAPLADGAVANPRAKLKAKMVPTALSHLNRLPRVAMAFPLIQS